MCWTSGLFRCKLSAARGENWNMLVAAAFRGGLVHFLAFLCEALLCGRQHAIYNQVHAQASMRYSAAARDLVGWLMQSGLPSKSPQGHSWRKPAWWRSPCMTKVWERFGPCIGELKESDAITVCPQSGGTLYVLRTWRLKSVSRTVLAEDVAQLEPMHHASHTVWYRIPGDAITGNGEWHKVYGFLDGYLKAFPCP